MRDRGVDVDSRVDLPLGPGLRTETGLLGSGSSEAK